jgi:hypothetical protein
VDAITTVRHAGTDYLAGSFGSLVLSCPCCGRDRFRAPELYFDLPDPKWEKCFSCETVMEPVRVSDIETKWRPIWAAAPKQEQEESDA